VAASYTSSSACKPIRGPDQDGKAIRYHSLPYHCGCMAAVKPSAAQSPSLSGSSCMDDLPLRAEPQPPDQHLVARPWGIPHTHHLSSAAVVLYPYAAP
jgi:hypothetical protein